MYRVLLTTVLLNLIEGRDEQRVILHRVIGDLRTEDLVGLDVDHGVDLIQPHLTFHFSHIHSPRLITLIPVLLTAMMTSAARVSGVTCNEGPSGFIRWEKVV